MKIITPERKGELFAITSGLLYGFVGYFGINIIHTDISVFCMLFWRFLVSTFLVGSIILLQAKNVQERPKQLLIALINGAVFYSISALGYFMASKLIGTGLAMVILFTYPAFVMLINYLLYNTTISKIYYGAISLIILGMALLVDFHDAAFNLTGIGFAIFAAIGYACYVVTSKKNPISPLISTVTVSIGCMITCFICAYIDASFMIPTQPTVWLNLLAIGSICTAIPILLLLYSLQYISSEKGSILSVLEPVFVVIIGVFLLGETISFLQVTGIITILGGALLTLL